MRTHFQAGVAAAALLTSLHAAFAHGASLDLSLDRGHDDDATRSGQRQLSPGMDLAFRSPLLSVAVDYDLQVRMDKRRSATQEDTAQRLGASLGSSALNQLLGGHAKVEADSVYRTTTGSYQHRFSPGFTRTLPGLATLDARYQVQRKRSARQAPEQQRRGYSVSLSGALGQGRLKWKGSYSAADAARDNSLAILNTETFRIQSAYRLLPQMRLNLTSAYATRKKTGQADATRTQTREYGAGLSWQLSPLYTVDFSLKQKAYSDRGDDTLLRKGSLSWFPRRDLALSLDYGDQLVQGARGVLLNTRLELHGF